MKRELIRNLFLAAMALAGLVGSTLIFIRTRQPKEAMSLVLFGVFTVISVINCVRLVKGSVLVSERKVSIPCEEAFELLVPYAVKGECSIFFRQCITLYTGYIAINQGGIEIGRVEFPTYKDSSFLGALHRRFGAGPQFVEFPLNMRESKERVFIKIALSFNIKNAKVRRRNGIVDREILEIRIRRSAAVKAFGNS